MMSSRRHEPLQSLNPPLILVAANPSHGLAEHLGKLVGGRKGPSDYEAYADIYVLVGHGYHVEVVAVWVSHVEGDNFQFWKVAGHIIQIHGKTVAEFSRRAPAEARMNIEYNSQFLSLLIERPEIRIIDACIFRRIVFKDLCALFLHPVFKLPY